MVPGLLRSASYARAVFRCRVPAHPEAEIEALTARRIAREKILRDPNEVGIMGRRYAMLRTRALNTERTEGLLGRLLGET